ncbi:MAG: hypothetical protein P1P93_04235 [Gammaproteobacteria bacterium]|nr:hypothetical protein [Gammaproteobacteria bacterium]
MKMLSTLLFIVMISVADSVDAELVVIGNNDLEIRGLTKKQIIDIYMGRYSVLPNGLKVIPLDQDIDSSARKHFYAKLVDKSISEINAYWARLLFSGRATPPRVVKTEKAVIEIVTKNASVIGYIDSSMVTDKVKVITRVE